MGLRRKKRAWVVPGMPMPVAKEPMLGVPVSGRVAPWEVRDCVRGETLIMPWQIQAAREQRAFAVERGTGETLQRAAIVADYDLACVIESVLNMRDGTVE